MNRLSIRAGSYGSFEKITTEYYRKSARFLCLFSWVSLTAVTANPRDGNWKITIPGEYSIRDKLNTDTKVARDRQISKYRSRC